MGTIGRDDIIVDDEFKKRLPPLTADERQTLKENIREEGGVNMPVCVWKEENICVDGHNRIEIHEELTEAGVKQLRFPQPKLLNFVSREDALRWMDQNARGQRNLTEEWRKLLVGREYNRRKKDDGGQADNTNASGKRPGHPDQVVSGLTSETIAREHGIGEKTVRRSARKARLYDAVEAEYGRDSEEARTVITATQTAIESVPVDDDEVDADDALAIIQKEKEKAARARKAKAKASSNGHAKNIGKLYSECTSPFQNMLSKAKKAGRLPEKEFNRVLGCVTNRRWFKMVVAELHYMRIEEHDDGTVELIVNEDERDLTTAILKKLEVLRRECGQSNRFKFRVDLLKRLVQDMYDLVCKASTHK